MQEKDKVSPAQVVRPNDCLAEMLYDLEHGKEKGSTTHVREIDKCWKWRKGEFNIWTGYSNEGKSLFLRYLALIKGLVDGWKFIFCAPEDFPAKEFYDDIIHTLAGQSTDRDNPLCIKKDKYMRAFELIKDNFIFIYVKPPYNTIKGVLLEMDKVIEQEGKIDGIIIDPLIKFARPKEMPDRDDIYASYITSLMTDYARCHSISAHLVMHQLTPRKTQDGFYDKPSMYQIKGGGTWGDGTDNILSVWRPNYAKDKLDTEVIFSSQKIKKQKLVGIPQEFRMKFDRKKNRYVDYDTEVDLFNFDKYFKQSA